MPSEWQPDDPSRCAPDGHLFFQDEESPGLWHPFDFPRLPPHLYQVPPDQIPGCRYFERYGQPTIQCRLDHHHRRACPRHHRLAAHGLPHLRLRQNVHIPRLPLRERRYIEGGPRLPALRWPNEWRSPWTNERKTNGLVSRAFQKVCRVFRWLLPLPGVLHDCRPIPACLCYRGLHKKIHGCSHHLALRARAANSVLVTAFPRFIHDYRMQIHRKLPGSCQISKLSRVDAYWASTGQYSLTLNEKEWPKQPTSAFLRRENTKDPRKLKKDGHSQLQREHKQHDGSQNSR